MYVSHCMVTLYVSHWTVQPLLSSHREQAAHGHMLSFFATLYARRGVVSMGDDASRPAMCAWPTRPSSGWRLVCQPELHAIMA
jgi:hypothetical protein